MSHFLSLLPSCQVAQPMMHNAVTQPKTRMKDMILMPSKQIPTKTCSYNLSLWLRGSFDPIIKDEKDDNVTCPSLVGHINRWRQLKVNILVFSLKVYSFWIFSDRLITRKQLSY